MGTSKSTRLHRYLHSFVRPGRTIPLSRPAFSSAPARGVKEAPRALRSSAKRASFQRGPHPLEQCRRWYTRGEWLQNVVCRATLRAWLGELASESVVGFLAPCKKGLTDQAAPPVLMTSRTNRSRDRPAAYPLSVTARGGKRQGRSGRGDGRQSSNEEMRNDLGASLTIIAPYRCS